MITTRLYGRRANQLFQIAQVLCYGVENRIEVVIPEDTLNNEAFPPRRFSGLRYKWGNNSNFPAYAVFKEKSHAHNNIPSGLDGVCFDGYWQSYQYLKGHERMLRQVFELPKLGFYKSACSVHIRRGDYTTLPEHHPLMPKAYYDSAFSYLIQNYGVKKFVIFSDDINWCKQHIVLPKEITVIFQDNKTGDEMVDLKLMMCYRFQVIANSSFSLFAALLNPARDKLIICPHKSQWFGPKNSHLDTKDLYPNDIRYYIPLKY